MILLEHEEVSLLHQQGNMWLNKNKKKHVETFLFLRLSLLLIATK